MDQPEGRGDGWGDDVMRMCNEREAGKGGEDDVRYKLKRESTQSDGYMQQHITVKTVEVVVIHR